MKSKKTILESRLREIIRPMEEGFLKKKKNFQKYRLRIPLEGSIM